MVNCRFTRAETVEDALESLQASGGDAHIFAGGVALGILMRSELVAPEWIIDVSQTKSLQGIQVQEDGTLSIGAAVTHAELASAPVIGEKWPLLREMAREIACGRVRNRGTIGGNICLADPQGDPPVALLVMDARLKIRGPEGARVIAIDDFFQDSYVTALEDVEVLERVEVSAIAGSYPAAYEKFGAREAMDYSSTVSAAAAIDLDPATNEIREARTAFAGVGVIPMRSHGAEALLRGTRPNDDVLKAVEECIANEVSPIGDATFSADYKRYVAGVLGRRAIARVLSDRATGGRR